MSLGFGVVIAVTSGCTSVAAPEVRACTTLDGCLEDCSTGEPEGCFYAGYRYEGGVEVPQDLARAEVLYAESCGGAFQPGCLGWMRILSTSEDKTRRARAVSLGEAACEEGYGEGCLRAGLLMGTDGAAMITRGFTILRRKCSELSDDSSCTILANLAFSGAAEGADFRVASNAFVRSCERGDPHACVRVGELLDEGNQEIRRVTKQPAEEYFDRACTLGLLRACTEQWTRRLQTQRADVVDEVRAGLSPLCRMGEADSCAVLAKLSFLDGPDDPRAYKESRDLYRRACTLKNGSACNSYGMMIAAGVGGARDLGAAYRAYVEGCDIGEREACSNTMWMVARSLVSGEDPEAGQTALDIACEGGDATSCYRVGQLKLLREDTEEAITLMERACRLGEADGCASLAVALLDKEGESADMERVAALAAYACQSESGEGCMLAGQLAEAGSGGPKDANLSMSFFRRACEYRVADGCEALARRAMNAEDAVQVWSVGRMLRSQECRRGRAADCVTFGVYLHRGLGGEASPADAARYYETGCEAGEAEGCLYVGQLWATGVGVEASYQRARPFLKRGCELGNNDACAWEGLTYHLADDADKDMSRALEIYERTCAAGSAFGCVGAGKVYESGEGRIRDRAKAREFFGAACRAGDARYCR